MEGNKDCATILNSAHRSVIVHQARATKDTSTEKQAREPKMPAMSEHEVTTIPTRELAGMSVLSCVLLWFSQPPCAFWPLAFLVLTPWLRLVTFPGAITKRGYLIVWGSSTVYWLLTLQGLRHAHPAMFLCWMALAGYLATYHVLFIGIARTMLSRKIALVVAIPVVWVGQECLRNYLLTGISAAMLGHTMADVPTMIQIADAFGTYGVSFVLALVNVAVFELLSVLLGTRNKKPAFPALIIASAALLATVGYGWFRTEQPLGGSTATFALIQRDEEVEYGQPREHEVTMFRNYFKQSIDSVRVSNEPIDVVVWPESMFSADNPWMIAGNDCRVPDNANLSLMEFKGLVQQNREYFLQRARSVQRAIAAVVKEGRPPHILAGCGVFEYRDVPHAYSGVVSISPDGNLQDWYGKTHLVMFGEYIPIAPYVPGLRSLVPPGLMLGTGPGAKRFEVSETSVAANICIETAVERVTVNHLATLHAEDLLPEVIVTVTNDGWFDDSSVIEHHLRCAQLVAVGCRRPILSAANNGPTAWIDSCGQVVDRLDIGINGAVIAKPKQDPRTSMYMLIGDWPARICTLACGLVIVWGRLRRPRSGQAADAS